MALLLNVSALLGGDCGPCSGADNSDQHAIPKLHPSQNKTKYNTVQMMPNIFCQKVFHCCLTQCLSYWQLSYMEGLKNMEIFYGT